jgi:hypothetical protein
MACAGNPKIGQCLTSAVSLTRQALNTTFTLLDDNTITADPTKFIPIYVPGPGVTCLSITLVTDAKLVAATSFTAEAADVEIAVQIKKDTLAPASWRQPITYTVPPLSYAAGTTQLVADVLPGYYQVYGTIKVGASAQSNVTATIDARINVTTVRETL